MLYPEPLVIQFYDILSDLEAEKIINLAMHEMKQATVFDEATGELVTADYR